MNKHLNQPESQFNTPKWQTVKNDFERYVEQEKQLRQFMEQFT
jgi:predicted RNA-binding protein with PUA-like domain